MTKEEEIRALVKEKNYFEGERDAHLMRADSYKDMVAKLNKRINWLAHLIRKGE